MCRLPSADIFPVVRVDSSGSTELVTNYLATDPSWSLAVGKSVAWPKCAQQVQGSDGILNYITMQKNAIGCVICRLPALHITAPLHARLYELLHCNFLLGLHRCGVC